VRSSTRIGHRSECARRDPRRRACRAASVVCVLSPWKLCFKPVRSLVRIRYPCVFRASCVVRAAGEGRACGRAGAGRLESRSSPATEKARMQKAISVHQTCSMYPYTEMARARETNSTTSLPRGGTTTPLGASCAHSSALLSPNTACERRARPRTHGELRTSGRCGEHLHARRLRKSRSEGRGRRAFGISSCRPSIPPSWARAAATYSGGRRGWGR
jgi:hypothetical protein